MSLSVGIVCYPSFGGSGVVACELATGLAARGHRVHLLATERPGRIAATASGVEFHQVEVPAYPLFEHAPYGLAMASAILELARAQRLDVVHVHYAVPHAASAVFARSMLGPGAPAVVTSLHGTDVTGIGAHPSYRSIIAAAVAASDGITVPSAFLRAEAQRKLGLPEEAPIEILSNFVDTACFSPPERRDRASLHALFDGRDEGPVLFHVSNFRAVKRTGDLVEVLARLRRHVPVRLVAVGDGPELVATQAMARALGVAGSVRFLGKRADFACHLRHADAFVLPSESESFGVAALEAMSAGVPVFGYRVGGLPEVVPEAAGRLVEPRDVDALAEALREALVDPAGLEAMGRAARVHAVEHYRREPALDRYEDYLRRLLAAREGRG